MATTSLTQQLPQPKAAAKNYKKLIWRSRYLYILVLPGFLYFLVYKYVPLLGSVIAFQHYNPFQGMIHSPWVGFDNFTRIFNDPEVTHVLVNTFVLSFLQIVFAFPIPLVIALMLNEIRSELIKRCIQSVIYLPHFLSWVVVVGVSTIFLRSTGVVNHILEALFGMDSIPFLQLPSLFKPLLILEVIWKEAGFGTIVFLATLAGVNPDLYEAATVDGANRWRKLWHITLPAIRGTFVILLILRLGNVLDNGFEQIFLMLNPFVMDVGNVLDTFVFYKGIEQSDFSFATAVGLFKGVVGLVLVVGANKLAKLAGEDSIY